MKNLILILVFSVLCGEVHSKSWISCKCGVCGSTDIHLESDNVRVDYDSCGRGGNGSHPIARYSVSHPTPDSTRLSLIKSYSSPVPDEVEWTGTLDDLTCQMYSSSCFDKLW